MKLKLQLRRWRKANRLTNQAAADFIGVPLRTFEDWQSGRRTPAGLSAAALAEKIKQPAPTQETNPTSAAMLEHRRAAKQK